MLRTFEVESGPQVRCFALPPVDAIQVIRVDGTITAGFPSPADDYLESRIDLKRELVRNPDATFIVRVQGDSMQNDGISDGDVLVVDRSVPPRHGVVAVCCLNDGFTVKRIEKKGSQIRLMPANSSFAPIVVQENDELTIWGVVTFVIKKI